MTSDRIRIRFLNFFQKKEHLIMPSDSLLPQHDPTLLFTGAGMNQFKDQFMGRNVTARRVATCQKCLRTADLQKVGRTPGHHTFFEMLGNFSFGDYFKKEAILWAWEFLTEDLGLPKEKLWVSVYTEDNEAYNIWQDEIGVENKRIIRLGDKENFWPSEVKRYGPNGPCGPSSEIFYDWGKDTGCGKSECDPSCDCGRFVEVWNLVFTQFERRDGGVLKPLPTKNIDTGMGLERLAAVIQNKKTNFEIDAFSHIIKSITKEVDKQYGKDKGTDSHINAIADHIRAITFAISDGVRPSNESRGFVVRKLIRRTSQRARALGVYEPFIYKIIPAVAKAMKAPYPQLAEKREDIAGVVLREEENLKDILDTVLPQVEEELVELKEGGRSNVPGNIIFKFYDEKGVPLDLIEEKAAELNLKLDLDGFNKLLGQQKVRSRDKSKVAGSIFFEKLSDVSLKTEFLYDKTATKAKVLGVLKEDGIVHIALDKTVFYGESGGQAGDRGKILGKNLEVRINDAKRYEDTIDHIGKIVKGTVSEGDEVEVKIDVERRSRIMKNHTATHLLHSALKKVLGGHVGQYGSLVEEDRLRFDFTHPAKLDAREIERVEELVNSSIEKDIPVTSVLTSLEDAKKSGAIALFGEKYKDKVLVRTIGDVSKELCGGTHVKKTKDIGAFKILSESSIASGVRRIEALTGEAVYNWLKRDIEKTVLGSDIGPKLLFKSEAILKKDIKDMTKADLDRWFKELKPKINKTIEELSRKFKKIKKETRLARIDELKNEIESFVKDVKTVGDIRVISRDIADADMETLRDLLDEVKRRVGSAVVILGSRKSSKANLVCGLTDDLVKKGLSAAVLVKRIAAVIGGSGGGRPDLAQAGGNRPDKLKEALELVFKAIEEEVSK